MEDPEELPMARTPRASRALLANNRPQTGLGVSTARVPVPPLMVLSASSVPSSLLSIQSERSAWLAARGKAPMPTIPGAMRAVMGSTRRWACAKIASRREL